MNVAQAEKRLIRRFQSILGHWLKIGVKTYADYNDRHVNVGAASISFYVIFSVFPLLAFLVYLVSQMTGRIHGSGSASFVIAMVSDFIPGMEGWIRNGLFNIIKSAGVVNWVNGLLLAWASFGLFSAIEHVVAHLPQERHQHEHSHVGQFLRAAGTFSLFLVLISVVILTQMMHSTGSMPHWVKGLPGGVKEALYYGAKSGALLWVGSILSMGTLFRLLLPLRVRLKNALLGGALFTGLLVVARSGYWIYIHYSGDAIKSTYGVFSSLVVIMLFVHFIVNCGVYCCSWTYHMELAAQAKDHLMDPSDSDAKAQHAA